MAEIDSINDLSENDLKKSIDSLLLSAYTVNSIGLMYGKAGIALSLFELSKHLDNKLIEDHAFNLLKEILTYNLQDNSFSNGKAGIAYVLQYLIKYDLLDADYMGIYGKCHNEIIGRILNLKYNEHETVNYIDYLLFIEMSVYISKTDYNKSHKILVKYIAETLDKFDKEIKPQDFFVFHTYSSRLLYIYNYIQKRNVYPNFFLKIEQINKKWTSDYISENPLFAFQFYIYGAIQKQENTMQEGKRMVDDCLKNIIPATLTLRQRIDTIVNVFKVYDFDKAIDYRYIAYKIFDSMIDSNIDSFEKKIVEIIQKGETLELGLGFGFSRLLLLVIYWKKISQGIFPVNITELLI
jgi:hypothetical protein